MSFFVELMVLGFLLLLSESECPKFVLLLRSLDPHISGLTSLRDRPVSVLSSLMQPLSPRHLQGPQQTLEAMLRPKVTTLPGHIQAVYVQNVVKLYASILQQKEQAADTEAAQEVTQLLVERLPQFVQSADLEVQERVRPTSWRFCSRLRLNLKRAVSEKVNSAMAHAL